MFTKLIDALKATLSGEDYEDMKAKQEELMKAFYEVTQKVYQANAPQGDPNAAGPAGDAPGADGYYDGEVH